MPLDLTTKVPSALLNFKTTSPYSLLSNGNLSDEFWDNLTSDERFEIGKSFNFPDKINNLLYHGFHRELKDYYTEVRTDTIPRELVLEWFLDRYHANIRFDNFKFKLCRILDDGTICELKEADIDALHLEFRKLFPWCTYNEALFYRRVLSYGQAREFDTFQNYLTNLPRSLRTYNDVLEEIIDCLEVNSTEVNLAKTYIAKWFAGIISRAFNPGCKFDLVLVLNGKQGIGKTTFLESIFPDHTYVMSNSRDLDSKDKLINLSTNAIVIWDEIGSFQSRYMNETIKQFVTLKFDTFRPVWGKQTVRRERRCVFCATTNEPLVLDDLTGNRRYMVITAGVGKQRKINTDRLKEIIPEFLSLSRDAWKNNELKTYLTSEESQLQHQNNRQYERQDTIREDIENWLIFLSDAGEETWRENFSTKDLCYDCLGLPLNATHDRKLILHIGKILKNLDYCQVRIRHNQEKHLINVWRKADTGKE